MDILSRHPFVILRLQTPGPLPLVLLSPTMHLYKPPTAHPLIILYSLHLNPTKPTIYIRFTTYTHNLPSNHALLPPPPPPLIPPLPHPCLQVLQRARPPQRLGSPQHSWLLPVRLIPISHPPHRIPHRPPSTAHLPLTTRSLSKGTLSPEYDCMASSLEPTMSTFSKCCKRQGKVSDCGCPKGCAGE